MEESIVVLDFGSQYTQLIARRVREQQVYCEILPYHTPIEVLREVAPKGLVLSGGPSSVYASQAPLCSPEVLKMGIPVLGICYGMQLITHLLGGKVDPAPEREFGFAQLAVDDAVGLFEGLSSPLSVWMSHGDRITATPPGFHANAHTSNSPIAAMTDDQHRRFGLQFHPEVVHTPQGADILRNFARKVCGCESEWTMESFVSTTVESIRAQVGGERILCAVSGGVDSTVLAKLVQLAVGNQLVCVFVNNGLLRKNEADEVQQTFQKLRIPLRYVDASARFLERLADVTMPEQKRKIIGNEFIGVFEDELKEVGEIGFLAQGTLYPDVIESISVKGPSATIKTHHNVGGLPEHLAFQLVEPLRELFKDEVRRVGRELGIPKAILGRHPFPGPGLAVRVLGEVTEQRLDLLREADAIFIGELHEAGIYDDIWQAFAVLLPVQSVGVMGDERTYEDVIALRAVTSTDGMTADWAHIPHEILGRIANRIINEVRGVNRVAYDISSKPPSTIEWE